MKSIAKHFTLAALILAPLAIVHASDSLEPVAIRKALESHDRAVLNEPQARVLYDKMIEALRQPQSLSYKSEHRWEARGETKSDVARTRSG